MALFLHTFTDALIAQCLLPAAALGLGSRQGQQPPTIMTVSMSPSCLLLA